MKNASTLITFDVFINDYKKRLHNIEVFYENDVAVLFNISVTEIKSIVKKNASRFPSDFLFRTINETTNEEIFAFTIAGLFMLSGQVKTELATKISIQLVELIVSHKPNFAFELLNNLESEE